MLLKTEKQASFSKSCRERKKGGTIQNILPRSGREERTGKQRNKDWNVEYNREWDTSVLNGRALYCYLVGQNGQSRQLVVLNCSFHGLDPDLELYLKKLMSLCICVLFYSKSDI